MIVHQLKKATSLVRVGHGPDALRAGARFLYSTSFTVGLHRDLRIAHTGPDAAIPIRIRQLAPNDVQPLLGVESNLTAAGFLDRKARLRMLDSGLSTAFVAVTQDDEPCYVQWLIGARDNANLRNHFGDRIPRLADDEMVLEGAFTPERWRGKGSWPAR